MDVSAIYTLERKHGDDKYFRLYYVYIMSLKSLLTLNYADDRLKCKIELFPIYQLRVEQPTVEA